MQTEKGDIRFVELETYNYQLERLVSVGRTMLSTMEDETYRKKSNEKILELHRKITTWFVSYFPEELIAKMCFYATTRGVTSICVPRTRVDGGPRRSTCLLKVNGMPDLEIITGLYDNVWAVYSVFRDYNVELWVIMHRRFRWVMDKWELCEDLQKMILDFI